MLSDSGCLFPLQETLMQLDQEEQYDKLEETFQSVKEGYERILGMME